MQACYLIVIQAFFWWELPLKFIAGTTVRLRANPHESPSVTQQKSSVCGIINWLKVVNSFFKTRKAFFPQLLLRSRHTFAHCTKEEKENHMSADIHVNPLCVPGKDKGRRTGTEQLRNQLCAATAVTCSHPRWGAGPTSGVLLGETDIRGTHREKIR